MCGGALHLPFGKIQKRQRIARSIFRTQKPQRPFVTKSFQISVKVPERYPHKRIKPPGAHRRKSHQFDCGVAVADMYIFMRQNKAKLLFFAIRRKHDFRLDNAYAERRACRVAREQRYSAGFIKALKNCVCGVAFFVLKAVAASQHIGMTYAKVCRKQHRSAYVKRRKHLPKVRFSVALCRSFRASTVLSTVLRFSCSLSSVLRRCKIRCAFPVLKSLVYIS